jgi:hypothetical protein
MSRTFSPSHWIVVISLIGLPVLVETPGQATTAGGADPPPAGSHQPSNPGKSGPATTAPSPAKPGHRLVPREQPLPIEERLQRGQMEEAVAQGQVSHRLEQFHKGSPEGTTESR